LRSARTVRLVKRWDRHLLWWSWKWFTHHCGLPVAGVEELV